MAFAYQFQSFTLENGTSIVINTEEVLWFSQSNADNTWSVALDNKALRTTTGAIEPLPYWTFNADLPSQTLTVNPSKLLMANAPGNNPDGELVFTNGATIEVPASQMVQILTLLTEHQS